MMEIKCLVQGPFGTNTYLVSQGEAMIIIDPTGKVERIIQALEGRKLVAILLTHGHFDHLGAADELIETYHCPIYLHPDDFSLATNLELNSLGRLGAVLNHAAKPLKEGTLMLTPFKIDVLETPGHTAGSVVFVIDKMMFTGDTLFKGSIGRTDLYSGDRKSLKASLNYLKTFKEEYTIYPGHDGQTTLNHEKLHNPYLK